MTNSPLDHTSKESSTRGMEVIEQAFFNAPVPISVFQNPELTCIFFNKSHAEKIDPDGSIDKTIGQVFPFLPAHELDLVRSKVLIQGQSFCSCEYKIPGLSHEYELRFSPYKINNEIEGIMVFGYETLQHEAPVKTSIPHSDYSKLWTLVNNSIELMSILELDGRNSYLNKAGMEMLGFDNFEQVLSTPISDLHAPEDIKFVEENVIPSVMQEGYWSGIMRVRHIKTKETFEVFNNAVRIDDPNTGQPIAIGAVMRDLRPERALQKALKKREENFRDLVLQAPFAIAVMKGPDHVLEIVNSKMMEIWGKTEEQLLDKPVFEAIPEARGIGLEEKLKKALFSGQTEGEYERKLIFSHHGHDSHIYVNYVYEPLRESNGEITGVLAVAIDVTEQVHARQKIEAAEEKGRLAVELADLGTFELDYSNDQLTTSQRFNEIFSVSEGATRRQMAANIHPEDLHIRNQAHRLSRQTGKLEYEVRLLLEDNTIRWIRIRGKIFFDPSGMPAKSIGVVLDITEQKLFAEELSRTVDERTRELQDINARLERSNAELEQFAYITSHDLQEPLRKIQVFSSILKEKLARTGKIEEGNKYLQKIGDSATRMSGLIRDLLDYSRIATGSQAFELVDLNQIAQNVLSDFELLITQTKATVKLGKLEKLPAIPLQLNQLFFNLVGNALKFSKKGILPLIEIEGHIISEQEKNQHWSLQKNADYYEIDFKDNGIGFDQEYSEKIFTIFQRLNQNDDYSGYGIGLALCRKIVTNHNGLILAEGIENQGACFRVILPMEQ